MREKPSESEQSSKCWCSACGIFFKNRREMNQHTCTSAVDKLFQCLSWIQYFGQKYHLKGHSIVRTGECGFKCSVCEKSFNDKSNLQERMRIHTGEKLYQCLKCKKSFTWKRQLENHKSAHKAKSYFQCYVCNMYFKNKGTWKNIYFHMLQKNHISVCHVLKVSFHNTISRDMVLFIEGLLHLTAECMENHLMIKATYNST